MSARFDHADHVNTVAAHTSAAASSPVAASWRRCLTLHGLTPEEARTPWRLTESEFHHARARSSVLIEEARGEIDRLIVTRPAVEAGEKLGFLPGDLTEKVDPYMAPVWEALTQIVGTEQLRRRRDKGEIEVAPIAFMRGRTLSHAFIIVDEAQNTSRLQMKMVLTRMGEGSRMAVTGDPSQIDLLNAADSGLAHAVAILEGVEGVAVTRFSAADVVRHPMVQRIVKAYDEDAAKRGR